MHVGREFYKYIHNIRTQPIHLGISCACSHMEQRVRYVTRTHRSGDRTWTTQEPEIYHVKITTYAETTYFQYYRCEDRSDDLNDEIRNYSVMKVQLTKGWQFGNEQTKRAYDEFKAIFIEKNQYKDRIFEMKEFDYLDQFEEKAMFVDERKPFCLSMFWFLFWSFLGMSWPYRLWMEVRSAQTDYAFQKVLFLK